jgi:hypothetical protein
MLRKPSHRQGARRLGTKAPPHPLYLLDVELGRRDVEPATSTGWRGALEVDLGTFIEAVYAARGRPVSSSG